MLKITGESDPSFSLSLLKGHGNEPNFCINRFGLGPLHYISGRSDFGFEFPEIFIFEKTIHGVKRGYVVADLCKFLYLREGDMIE